jgi:hypothetical protein
MMTSRETPRRRRTAAGVVGDEEQEQEEEEMVIKKTSIMVEREEKQNKAKAQRAQAAATNNDDDNQRRHQRHTHGQAGGNRGRQERRERSREEPARLCFLSFFPVNVQSLEAPLVFLSPSSSLVGSQFHLSERRDGLKSFSCQKHPPTPTPNLSMNFPPPPGNYPFVKFLFVEKCKPKGIN